MKFRAVDIPIMAAPSEQKVGLAVQVKRGSTCLLSTFKTFRMSQSLQEVFDCFDLDVAGEVVKAEAADRPSSPWRSIDMQETVDVLASFNARHVVFWLARAHEVEDPVEAVHLEQNAFDFLMASASTLGLSFWWMGGKKKKKNPTDRPSLKKAVEGNQTNFFWPNPSP